MTHATTADYPVRDFGATGDGATNDTRAVQRAIDACHAGGGGRVVVAPGRFSTGTIWLKSHVELHLCAGAEIRGRTAREDYNADDAYPENGANVLENVTGAHLVIAHRAENVSITGPGAIVGNGPAFFEPLPPAEITAGYRFKTRNFPIGAWRPGQMVVFCRCTGVRVTDVRLLDAPYWTLLLHGCDEVAIRGVTVCNAPQTANGDGIDIDLCRNVTVSDCRIFSGDDSITIRASNRRMPDRTVCENVAVSNCVLHSPCCAVRVGVGDAQVRNIRFSNLVITDSRTAVMFVCRYSTRSPRGAAIEDVHFSNLRIDAVHALHLRVGHPVAPPAGIRRVSFSQVDATCDAGSLAAGVSGAPIEDLLLSGVTFRQRAGAHPRGPAYPEATPEAMSITPRVDQSPSLSLPAALAVMHAERLVLSNVRLCWEAGDPSWANGLFLRDAHDVHLAGCSLPAPPSAGAAVRCEAVHGLAVQGCRFTQGPDASLQRDPASDPPVSSGNIPDGPGQGVQSA